MADRANLAFADLLSAVGIGQNGKKVADAALSETSRNMPHEPPDSLLSFLGAEHTNELVSTYRSARALDVFTHIDGLWRAPVKFLDVPAGLHAVAQLYLFVHYQLYVTLSNLMRMHVSEALGCERKAIDATLCAYEIIANPESAAGYKVREWKFLNIKRFIEKALSRDATRYPLAVELLKTWDFCSQFGAHADYSTFALRLDEAPVVGNPDQRKLFFMYFQIPQTDEEAQFYYADTFVNFLSMARIFEPFIQAHAKELPYGEWSAKLNELDHVARKEWARLRDLIDAQKESGYS